MENKKAQETKKVTVNAEIKYIGKGFKDTDTRTHYTFVVAKEDCEKFKTFCTEIYKNVNDMWIPKWYKDFNGTVYTASKFDVPASLPFGEKFDDCAEGVFSGAECRVKFIGKNGAIYPRAVVVVKNGEEKNPFDDMD